MRVPTFVLLLHLASSAAGMAAPAQVTIEPVEGAIAVDGEVSEAAWQSVAPIDGFVEYFRGDNTTPPAKTVARIGYDASSLYVAFVAYDENPGAIRAPLLDRDKVLGDQDYVAVLLDPQNDGRSGVVFRVNPRGVQADSVVDDATGEENFSPDFLYEAAARRTADGWSAELRIPLSSLRYPATDVQTWGVILMRNYPRDYRYIMANTTIPKSSGCFVCHAARLSGLAGLPSRTQHLTLAPYATVQNDWRYGAVPAGPARSRFGSDVGLDLKWTPSSKMKIDATLNPDFSQVESDVPQLSGDPRFALSYPEKRAFFQEGTDLLSMPVRAVYTRSITAPAWGIRGTGQLGETGWTLLLAEDRGGGTLILPGPDGSAFAPQQRSRVAVGRARHTLGSSFAGFLLTAREMDGGGHNRVLGPDFLWQLDARDRVVGQVLYSDTDDAHGEGEGNAARFVYTRDAKSYDLWAAAAAYSPGFRADTGFVAQNDVRRAGVELGLRRYPKRFFTYVRPHAGVQVDQRYDGGERIAARAWQAVYFDGMWGSSGWATVVTDERLVKGRMLRYRWYDLMLRAAPRSWLPAVQVGAHVGEKVDYAGARVGSGALVNVSATFRPNDHLEAELRTAREWLDAGGERQFTTDVDWVKLTYAFSVRSFVRVIAQRESHAGLAAPRRRSLDLSALYAYKLGVQTLLYVGYGDAGITGPEGNLVPERRSAFMKVAYAFQP